MNIVGLSIGIATSLLISLFILNELSYDRFFANKDRIFRLILNGKIGDQELMVSSTAAPIGPTMLLDFPEVEDFVRINTWGETNITFNEISFTESDFFEADSSFFRIFSIPLLRGDKKTVLNAPHQVVLSEATSRKIFGSEDPVGKLLKIGNDTVYFRVTGIFGDIPDNCSFKGGAISSFVTNYRANDNQWLSNSFETFLLLKPGTSSEAVNAKTPDMIYKYVGPTIQQFMGITLDEFFSKGNKYSINLQALTDIHLDTRIMHSLKPSSDPKYLFIFGSVAVLIIIIAAINFMNLSTAQASRRARETGIKKVSGSTRMMLINQFISESVILSVLSLLVAIVIVELSLNFFNNLLQSDLRLNYFGNWYTIPLLIILALFVGILSGSYPAFFLSSFNPNAVLKGKVRDSMKTGLLRSILVVIQFSISIILIVGSLIMFRQIHFMLNKDLGFKKENLVIISHAETLRSQVKAFKETLEKIPEVVSVASSTAAPAHSNNNNGYLMEGRTDETFLLETNWVDHDYLKTYELEVVAGRFFDESFPSDENACLVNESAVRQFNLTSPLTARFMTKDDENSDSISYIPIIGVVRDFHFRSFESEITPCILRFKRDDILWGYVTVSISSTDPAGTIRQIDNTWKEFTSNDPMQYAFLDEDFARLYKEEQQNSKLSVIFTIIAILIASLGLFGLTSYTVEQRTKEIGVRKAMGATIRDIYLLISKEILVLVTISGIIALPVIYFIARNWLQNYYYRISPGVVDFLIGFAIAIVIAVLTVSYRTIRSARANPVDSLRYE